MQYVILLINIALALWLVFNLYQAIVAFLGWRKEANPEPFYLFYLSESVFWEEPLLVRWSMPSWLLVSLTYCMKSGL